MKQSLKQAIALNVIEENEKMYLDINGSVTNVSGDLIRYLFSTLYPNLIVSCVDIKGDYPNSTSSIKISCENVVKTFQYDAMTSDFKFSYNLPTTSDKFVKYCKLCREIVELSGDNFQRLIKKTYVIEI